MGVGETFEFERTGRILPEPPARESVASRARNTLQAIRELHAQFRQDLERLEAELREIQRTCPHVRVEVTRDPSGNNDHDYTCPDCRASGREVRTKTQDVQIRPKRCGVLFRQHAPVQPEDPHGCLLVPGHLGPHRFVDGFGRTYEWKTDLECDCESCQSDDADDWCVIYWPTDSRPRQEGSDAGVLRDGPAG